jgi:hypothetical protein
MISRLLEAIDQYTAVSQYPMALDALLSNLNSIVAGRDKDIILLQQQAL